MVSIDDLEQVFSEIREQCIIDLIKDTTKYSEWQKGKLAGKIELIDELMYILESRANGK